ncbi:MAG TPA: hypothetical protein VMJ12_11635 [Candidatus Acidoferrales bacterium]|nr:hypothetical protein [Candidatus Acidoferrales bacterium]
MNINQATTKNAVKAAANVCIASCQKFAVQIERAKERILAELQESLDVPERLFRLALGEAEALAWQTEYPHLFFPALAAEKVQAAAAWTRRQQFLNREKSILAMSI